MVGRSSYATLPLMPWTEGSELLCDSATDAMVDSELLCHSATDASVLAPSANLISG